MLKVFLSLLFASSLHAGTIFLAGEPLQFDRDLHVQFTARQLHHTADATRDGLVRFLSTPHGQQFIRYFLDDDCDVVVTEDQTASDAGSAPQPGIATLTANPHASRRMYEVVLNPTPFETPKGMKSELPQLPSTTSDLMLATWAAELLHVWFYAHGISLPHHERADFQQEWTTIAAEIGFPTLEHGIVERVPARPYWRMGR